MRNGNGMAAVFAILGLCGTAANAGQTQIGKLKLRVVTDKKTYAVNAPIKMTLIVKDADTAPIPLTFASGQRYDFTILQGKTEVWKWSKGRMFAQDFRTEILGGGKAWKFTETYKPGTPNMPALKPGTYTLSAHPETIDKDVSRTETTFKITAAK